MVESGGTTRATQSHGAGALGAATPALSTVLVATLLACALPGVGILDAHAALLLAPVIGWACGALTRAGLHRRLAARGVRRAAAGVVLGPVALLLLHGLRVPSCAPGTGLLLWLLGPLGAAIVGACMAVVAARLWPRRPHLGWWALALLSALPPLHAFLVEPTVASWHELFGMIPGSIYEDALGPDLRTLAFRATTTPFWLALAAWAAPVAPGAGGATVGAVIVGAATIPAVTVDALEARRVHGATATWPARRRRLALVVAATALAVGALRGGADGWRVRRADVLRALPVRVELRLAAGGTADGSGGAVHGPPVARPPEVVLHLAAAPGWRKRARLLAEDAAVRWHELRALLGVQPRAPVEIFVYLHDDQKRALMGAHGVEMAKPWLGQAHLVDPGYGDSVLAHELAHVFGAAIAAGPFGVPMRFGLLPDAIRIEGLAVAAEWPTLDGLDPHAQAAAMAALGLLPRIEALLSPLAFAVESSARAYTAGGSLLRYVGERCGRAALHAVYRGTDLDDACAGAPGSTVAAWRAHLASMAARLSPADLERQRARFASPGLLHRPCPLETGRCRERAARAYAHGDQARVRAEWSALLTELRRHVGAGALPLGLELALASALAGDGALAQAEAVVVARLQRRPRASDRAALLTALGDLRLRAGDDASAQQRWAEAAALPRAEAALRTLRVKAALAATAPGRDAVLALFALGGRRVEPRQVVDILAAATPRDPLARYLRARRRLFGADTGEARGELAELAAMPEVDATVRRECLRLLALDASRLGLCAAITPLAWAAGADVAVVAWHLEFESRCGIIRTLGPARRWRAIDTSRPQRG